jgi:hypothetical protein
MTGKQQKGPEQRPKGGPQREQAAGQSREGGPQDKAAQHTRQPGHEAGKQRADEHNR